LQFGFTNDHLYIEVPSDVGVVANDVSSFEAYIQSNQYYLILPIKHTQSKDMQYFIKTYPMLVAILPITLKATSLQAF